MDLVLKQSQTFLRSGASGSFHTVAKFAWEQFWPWSLKWCVIFLPLVIMMWHIQEESANQLALFLLSLCWMLFYPYLFFPLRSGHHLNLFSCFVQSLWGHFILYPLTHSPFLVVLHIVNQSGMLILPSDTEDSIFWKSEQWPSWVNLALTVTFGLIQEATILSLISALSWGSILLYFAWPLSWTTVSSLTLPWTLIWLLIMCFCRAVQVGFFRYSPYPILVWLNLLYWLFDINRKVHSSNENETWRELGSLLPELLTKFGADMLKIAKIAKKIFGILTYVGYTTFGLSLLKAFAILDIFVGDTFVVHIILGSFNLLINISIMVYKVFDLFFWDKVMLKRLENKKDKDLTPQEHALKIFNDAEQSKKRGIKAKTMKVLRKHVQRQKGKI